ncbi:MAG TPA: HipA family kinase [Casimicrobiaceae bacterium]|jgi:hypothetical protein
MPLREIPAVRYVTPLREGGSLPAVVEGDDAGLYVLKFRGAGQGPNALIAEIIVGELARAAGLAVPEIVLMALPADLARTEPDPEIQDLLRASAGLNVALDYLPGATMFDPVVDRPDATLAAAIVWLDALTLNVDRTPRNTNLLMWHRRLWLIDHGAALYFHHAGGDYRARSSDPFPRIAEHVLLPFAAPIGAVDDALAQKLAPAIVEDVVARVPDAWLEHDPAFASARARRAAYVDFLLGRLAAPRAFVMEAERARAVHV